MQIKPPFPALICAFMVAAQVVIPTRACLGYSSSCDDCFEGCESSCSKTLNQCSGAGVDPGMCVDFLRECESRCWESFHECEADNQKPTSRPSQAPTRYCIDHPNWLDSPYRGGGDGCSWYETNGCGTYGDTNPSSDGFTANQACCTCGGGDPEVTPCQEIEITKACNENNGKKITGNYIQFDGDCDADDWEPTTPIYRSTEPTGNSRYNFLYRTKISCIGSYCTTPYWVINYNATNCGNWDGNLSLKSSDSSYFEAGLRPHLNNGGEINCWKHDSNTNHHTSIGISCASDNSSASSVKNLSLSIGVLFCLVLTAVFV